MAQKTKVENFEKVREYVKNIEVKSLTNYEIQQKIGLNYSQSKSFLNSLVEIGELKYIESLKIYIKESE